MGHLVLKERNVNHSIKEYISHENKYIRPATYSHGKKGLYNLTLYKNGQCIVWYVIFKEITSFALAKDSTAVLIRIKDKMFILGKDKNTEVHLTRITDNVEIPTETYFI